MSLAIRTLLIWLLVLGVPAQGAAAATMAFCGPNHHAIGGDAQQAAPADHAHHGGSAAGAHEHHPHAVAYADDDGSADSAVPAKFTQADKHKCSACASCCSFGALLSDAPALPVLAASATVFCTVVPSVDDSAVDGPDRPPRSVLA